MNVWAHILLGGAFLLLGWALLFLAVIGMLPKTFPLAIVAGALMIAGSGLGFYGVTGLIQKSRQRRD